MDDPSGKVRGIIGSCGKCQKTKRSKIVTFVCIFAILCGVAFTSYAVIIGYRGIDPESHWFGSASLAVADWMGQNHENISTFAALIDLLIYIAVGLAGGGVLLFRRIKKAKTSKQDPSQPSDA